MLIVNIISLIFLCTNIAIGKLSDDIKNNIKFQCGEIVEIGGDNGHIDGDGEETREKYENPKKYFELKKDIEEDDHLAIKYAYRCGKKDDNSDEMEICQVLESDDDSSNLMKSFINLFGFNATSCPIPAGNYTSMQENILDPLLIDLFGSNCNDDLDFTKSIGFINAAIVEDGLRILNGFWEEVPKDNPDYQKCGSAIENIL